MASLGSHALAFLFAAIFILAMAGPSLSCPVVYCENETTLRLYLHRLDSQDQTTAAPSSQAGEFGKIVVNDWAVVDAPTPGATIVARGQGMQLKASVANSGWFNYITIVFQDSSRSTLVAIGSTDWAIVGGTGQFANAHGTIKLKLIPTSFAGNFIQLDIHAFANPDVVPATGFSLPVMINKKTQMGIRYQTLTGSRKNIMCAMMLSFLPTLNLK